MAGHDQNTLGIHPQPIGVRSPATHLAHLDGLRGVASIVIVVSHLLAAWLPSLAFGQADGRVPYLAPLAHTPLAVFWAGDTCVSLFFIHSGFVLSNRYLGDGDRSALTRQLVKRVIRLGIPVAAAILLTGALVHAHLMHNAEAAAVSSSGWLGSFYAPGPHPGLLWSALGGSLLSGSNWWMGPLWSISIQFFGSLVVFALASQFGRDRRRHLVYGAVVVWSLFAGSSRFGVHVAAFVIGLWFRSAHEPSNASSWIRSSRWSPCVRFGIVGVISVLTVYLASWPDEQTVGPWYSTVAARLSFMDNYLRPRAFAHTIAAAGAFWLVLTVPSLGRLLARSAIRRVGSYSFAIYLLHWPVLMSAGAATFAAVATRWHSLYLGAAVASGTTVALTAVASVVFTRLVDQPAILLAHRFGAWWTAPKASPKPALLLVRGTDVPLIRPVLPIPVGHVVGESDQRLDGFAGERARRDRLDGLVSQ